MSNNQDINTNAQATDDQDTEGHFRQVTRSDEGMAPGPQDRVMSRDDAPDGEDDVEGHFRQVTRSGEGDSDAGLGPEDRRRR